MAKWILISNFAISQDVYTESFMPPTPIPDPGCYTVEIEIIGTGNTLGSAYGFKEVCVNINHPFLADVNIYLISPADVTVDLINNRGSFGDDLVNTCFDGNTSSPPISAGSAPFTGSFQPETPLGLVNDGSAMDGIWKLVFCDDTPSDAGSIVDYKLTFDADAPTVIPAENDECINFITIPVNNSYDCDLFATGTLAFATASSEPNNCSSSNFNNDVWFSFVAEDEEHIVSIFDANPSTPFIIEFLSGNCTSLNSITCSTSNTFQIDNLISGSTYYIRVASNDQLEYSTIFKICISEGVPSPPANDEYCGAYDLNSGNGYCYVDATFAGALNTGGIASCQGQVFNGFPDPNNDIWFKFIASNADHNIRLSNIVGTSNSIYLQLLSGTVNCNVPNESFSNVLCYIDPQPGSIITFTVTGLNIGTEYYLRLATFSNPQNTVFDICLDNANPPPNDACANATQLIVDQCSTASIFSLTDATQSPEDDPCDELPIFYDDVWFKFTAAQSTHIFDAFNINGSSTDLIFELLSGTCADPSLAFCYDEMPNGNFSIADLIPGNDYLLRVASFSSNPEIITFNLCIKTQNACPSTIMAQVDEGSYSLRSIVNCSSQNDTKTFDGYLSGKTLEINNPGIIFDNNLILDASQLSSAVIIENLDINNTDVILDIQSIITLKNIQIKGKSSTSMNVTVRSGSELRIQ